MPKNEQPEKSQVYILRREHRKEWFAKAKNDETAKLVMWAASKRMKDMETGPVACLCCDRELLRGETPRAFIVLIPTERDPEKVQATAGAVCPDCSMHDDEWLIDQGLRREGLSAAGARPGDKLH